MKLGKIDFPKPLLDALHDNELVVFAGAGVSMGEPACLPNFGSLSSIVGKGTGKTQHADEKPEQFLGRLQDQFVKVHARAARALSQNVLQPTDLHGNLLRLYPKAGPVRLVTTNFDLLFELAAVGMFDDFPEIFRAPALPLGYDFCGIVHGSVAYPDQMVLTDKDFGSAYLTEGWAQRFLVELFSNLVTRKKFVILFVGYSHDDTIMNYLVRALPTGFEGQRFIMTGSKEEKPLNDSRSLGIEPIVFPQPNKGDFSELNTGIHSLAELKHQRVAQWKAKITKIAQSSSPVDKNKQAFIEYALGTERNTRFFVDADPDSDWIDWLDERGFLKNLFGNNAFDGRDRLLSWWLAKCFVYNDSTKLFSLIAKHNSRIHPRFWDHIASKLNRDTEASSDKTVLSRWISMLLSTVPEEGHTPDGGYVYTSNCLGAIAKHCVEQQMLSDSLLIFDAMIQGRVSVRDVYRLPFGGEDEENLQISVEQPALGKYDELNELWQGLYPYRCLVAVPLLERVIRRLEDQYLSFRTWTELDIKLERVSEARFAIEDREQNVGRDESDVLIDVARDCLDWLVSKQREVAAQWCHRLAKSDSPLQHRLAVYALAKREDLTPDDKIQWLLAHFGLHEYSLRYEVWKVVQETYSAANPQCRKSVIDDVFSYRSTVAGPHENGESEAQVHIDWLQWLLQSDPGCSLGRQALDTVLAKYSHLRPREHPDRTSWIQHGYPDFLRPLTAQNLLAKPAADCLDDLLLVETTPWRDPENLDEIRAVAEASKQNFTWSLELANALAQDGNWEAFPWRGLIRAWSEMKFDESQHNEVFFWLAKAEVHSNHGYETANALYALVKSDGPPHVLSLLPRANQIAVALWKSVNLTVTFDPKRGWFESSIDYPVWGLTNYWLSTACLWRKRQAPVPTTLSEEYRQSLTDIIKDPSPFGGLGKSLLANNLAFLLDADEHWTREHLLPLFEPGNADFQPAWDGFVRIRRMDSSVTGAMADLFLKAVKRINADLVNNRRGVTQFHEDFIRCYTQMTQDSPEDALEKWIPRLFDSSTQDASSHTTEHVRFSRDCRTIAEIFASEMTSRLQKMRDGEKQELWQRWLKDYWQNRLDGVPAPLTPREADLMLDWLIELEIVFPDAVEIAVEMPRTPLLGSRILSHIEINDTPQKHLEAVATLFIYLWDCDPSYMRNSDKKLIDLLLLSNLLPRLKGELEDIRVQL